jgi:hypothetical protein
VFGWKNIHMHDGELLGKKQDKAGHWRSAKLPHYSTDPVNAYAIDERMKAWAVGTVCQRTLQDCQGQKDSR